MPKTATQALSGVTMPYAVEIASQGIAAIENKTIKTGVNTYQGNLTEKAVADSLDMKYVSLDDLVKVEA